jgi:hypothetical protein
MPSSHLNLKEVPFAFDLKASPDEGPNLVARRRYAGRSATEIAKFEIQMKEAEAGLKQAVEHGKSWAVNILNNLHKPTTCWEAYVRCSDGEIRRFPPLSATASSNSSFLSQIAEGLIYTSPKEFSATHAGFAIDENTLKGSFVVNGQPVQPAYVGNEWEVYRLEGGLHMVPQPNHLSCTDACIKMAALDQGYVEVEQLNDGFATFEDAIQSRSDSKGMTNRAKREFGADLKTHVFEVPWPSGKEEFLENLRTLIAEKPGSYTWSPTPGHEMMLDGLEKVDGQWKIAIRDPLHAKQETITENPSFWCARGTTVEFETLRIDVLYLPPKDDGAP